MMMNSEVGIVPVAAVCDRRRTDPKNPTESSTAAASLGKPQINIFPPTLHHSITPAQSSLIKPPMRVHESSANFEIFLRRERTERSGSEAESRAPAVGHAGPRRAGLAEGFHPMPFFLNAFLSFFVASPSAGVGWGHPSSSSYRCVNTKAEHKKT